MGHVSVADPQVSCLPSGQIAMSFKSRKVWMALRRTPGLTSREIAEVIGWAPRRVSDSLNFLAAYKSVYFVGRKRGWCMDCRWWATDVEPIDGRGLTKGSQLALRQHQPDWRPSLAAANVARRAPKRVIPKPVAITELERCWPIGGILRQVRQE